MKSPVARTFKLVKKDVGSAKELTNIELQRIAKLLGAKGVGSRHVIKNSIHNVLDFADKNLKEFGKITKENLLGVGKILGIQGRHKMKKRELHRRIMKHPKLK